MKILLYLILLLTLIVVTPAIAQDTKGDNAMLPIGRDTDGTVTSGYVEGNLSHTWSFITGMPQNLPSGIRVDNVQTKISDGLNKIIMNLESALVQIDSDTNLSVEQKAQLKKKAQETIKQITILKESVNGAKSLSDLISVASIYASSDQNTGIPVDMNVTGIQSMVNNLNLQGADVNSLQQQLNHVRESLLIQENGSTMSKAEIVKKIQMLKNEIVNFKLRNPKFLPSKGPTPSISIIIPSGVMLPTLSVTGKDMPITPIERICLQVITSATNNTTGECKEFPNSCLPEGWSKVASCTQ